MRKIMLFSIVCMSTLLIVAQIQASPPGRRGGGKNGFPRPNPTSNSASTSANFGASPYRSPSSSRLNSHSNGRSMFGTQRHNTAGSKTTASPQIDHSGLGRQWQNQDRVKERDHLRKIYGASAGTERQRLNENRKLDHRLNQADHLSQISERNGNQHLGENADRMRQQAQQHFDSRNQRIDSQQQRIAQRNEHRNMSQNMHQQNRVHGQPQQTDHDHPATAKKPSMLDRVRGLWPFK